MEAAIHSLSFASMEAETLDNKENSCDNRLFEKLGDSDNRLGSANSKGSLHTAPSCSRSPSELSIDTAMYDWIAPNGIIHHPAHHHIARRKEWPYGTYRFYEVPPNFKEPYIYTGYRSPTSSISDCIKYCISSNNELMNVWTHFLAFLVTLAYLIDLSTRDEFDFIHDPYTWPFFTYMISCCVYPLVSSFAHCFDCVSARARHVMFFMDYSAIAMYGFATSLAQYAYCFPMEFSGTSLQYLFIPIAFFNSCLQVVLSCESRFIEFSPYCKYFRLLAFIVPFLWSLSPMLYRGFVSMSSNNNMTDSALGYHQASFATGVVSSILFSFRLPESKFPGKFDTFFHSHQTFHVFCSISTYLQMQGIIADYLHFKSKQHLLDPLIFTFKWTLGLWMVGVSWCVVIVHCCQKRVYCFQNEQLYQMLLHVPRITCSAKPTKERKESSSSSSSSDSDTDEPGDEHTPQVIPNIVSHAPSEKSVTFKKDN